MYVCKYCGREFDTEHRLAGHIGRVHSTYKDNIKGKLFEVFSKLEKIDEENKEKYELLRVIAIKLLDNDKEKAKELALRLVEELNEELLTEEISSS